MAKGKSKLHPQHPHWYEDLPERDAPPDRQPQMVHGDVNAMDGTYLEVSRVSSLMRGGGLLFGSMGLFIFLTGIVFIVILIFDKDVTGEDFFNPFVGLIIGVLAGGWGVALSFKSDIFVPKDRPVRFNRARRKVYVYGNSINMNPFIKWPITAREFDWDTLHAEMHRHAGFTGKVYIQRFALYLVSCKPGYRLFR